MAKGCRDTFDSIARYDCSEFVGVKLTAIVHHDLSRSAICPYNLIQDIYCCLDRVDWQGVHNCFGHAIINGGNKVAIAKGCRDP